MNNLVSIITPCFNSEKFISQSIQSVIDQTYTNWEMIIVDDYSIDKTVVLVEKFLKIDDRIQLFKLDKNSGAGVARNFAIQKSSGNFIAFLDADDLWKPEKLQKQLDFMKLHDLPFTFSFYETIDEAGKSLNETITTPLKISYNQLYYCNWIGNLTAIYSADYFGKIEISSIKKRQDWLLYLQIFKKIKTAMPLPESLAFYRVREDSISASKLKLLKYNFNVYRQFHKKSFVVSIFDMIRFLYVQLFVKPKYKIKK